MSFSLRIFTRGIWVIIWLFQIHLAFGQIEQSIPEFILEKPVVAIVNEVRSDAKEAAWEVFLNKELTQRVGLVHPGDTAEVIGWSYWLYYIKTKSATGYISLLALGRNEEIKPIRALIIEKSEERDNQDVSNYIPPPITPIAHLSLSTNKKTIFVGECITLRYEFNVAERNAVRMQFYDLGSQITPVFDALRPKDAWEYTRTGEIVGVRKMIGRDVYTSYGITQLAFCPSIARDIFFPETELKFLTGSTRDEVLSDLITFKSEAYHIAVKPLPADANVSASNGYKMIGKFELVDSILATNVSTGIPINYKVSISGEGLTYPIPAPEIKMENMTARIVNIIHSDTVINESYFSEKEFTYSLVFKNPGTYNLSDKIHFNYFTPGVGLSTLSSKSQVFVIGDKKKNIATEEEIKFRNLIAIDNSSSMMIEDYKPFRLRAATMGVADFIEKRKACEVGVFAFAGDVNYKLISEPNCETRSIEELGIDKIKNGTAIGNAIFQAAQLFPNDNEQKKLIIIGDGDNTAGSIAPEFAIKLVKNHNIKIYTIGIGNRGEVPFGKDFYGKSHMVSDTFNDNTLKLIASLTGAKYYHAKSSEDLTKILSHIFIE